MRGYFGYNTLAAVTCTTREGGCPCFEGQSRDCCTPGSLLRKEGPLSRDKGSCGGCCCSRCCRRGLKEEERSCYRNNPWLPVSRCIFPSASAAFVRIERMPSLLASASVDSFSYGNHRWRGKQ